jgi:pyruvate-ferredoxin/flavodoxin oxidoreductase
VKVRLYRPFDVEAFPQALPPTVKSIAVMDRTKEPGAIGEPLYQDVITALAEGWSGEHPVRPCRGHRRPLRLVVQGIHAGHGQGGLRRAERPSPEAALHGRYRRRRDEPEPQVRPEFSRRADDVTRAVFYGLGSDGTVGASKNSVKIVGENTSMYAQGYFVYDSKKAGSVTVSHLRFSPARSTRPT